VANKYKKSKTKSKSVWILISSPISISKGPLAKGANIFAAASRRGSIGPLSGTVCVFEQFRGCPPGIRAAG